MCSVVLCNMIVLLIGRMKNSRGLEDVYFFSVVFILGECLASTVLYLISSDVNSPKIMFYTSFMILEAFESKAVYFFFPKAK